MNHDEEYIEELEGQIIELETKLAKAVEVLEKIAGYDAQGWALVTLAELTEEDPHQLLCVDPTISDRIDLNFKSGDMYE